MSAPEFRTFCHISEYDEAGYRNLHRLIAGSKPVVLWSPSSTLLRAHGSVPVADYISLIEQGLIRIIGREEWLLDRNERDRHPWAGARWDKEIDDAIYRIYIQDLHVSDERQKRVIVAEPEPGTKWAEEALEEHPEQLPFWNEVLTRPNPEDFIPAGTLQAIRRNNLSGEDAARRILRDARNHGEAVRDARADVPFLLSRSDMKFLEILAKFRFAPGEVSPGPPSARATGSIDTLAEQLLAILGRLDESRGEHRLLQFIKRKGHDELIVWLADCRALIEGGSTLDEEALLRSLIRKVRSGQPRGVRQAFDGVEGKIGMLLAGVGLTGTVFQAGQEQSLVNLLGLAFGVLSLTLGTLRSMGYVPGGFDGPQWSYLYSLGGNATRGRRRQMIDVLASDDC